MKMIHKTLSTFWNSLFPLSARKYVKDNESSCISNHVQKRQLKYLPFDNNLNYQDNFQKITDSTQEYTRTYYRNPEKTSRDSNPEIPVGYEVGTILNQTKNGKYQVKMKIPYLIDHFPEIILWDKKLYESLETTEIGTYVNNIKKGPYTILYMINDAVICKEVGTYQNNQKQGSFTRYYQNPLDDEMLESFTNLEETGTFFEDTTSNSVLKKKSREGKLCFQQTLKKTIKRDKRQKQSNLRIICEYTMESKNRLEHGCYRYSFYDIQYYLFLRGNLYRRGDFFFENRYQSYHLELESLCRQKLLPVELQFSIQSFLPPSVSNRRMGQFVGAFKKYADYSRKGILSDDGNYIHIHNVPYLSNYRKRETLTFEKNLLLQSPLFDNETFCFVEKISIGYTYALSKYHEPLYKIETFGKTWKSILRFLFDKKNFHGHVIFKNGNRNLISYDNVQFVSEKEFLDLEGPITELELSS